MATNWGLVDNATANSPQQTLEEMIAAQAARAEAQRKIQIEQRKLGQDDRRIAVDEGGLALNRDKFGNEVKTKQQEAQEQDELLKTLPSWLVPAAKLRKSFNMTVDPRDIAMSPEDQHTQQLTDETAKAAAAAAARAEDDARQLRNQQTLKGTPSYDDTHPKPAAAPKPANIPSSVKLKRADMGTIEKMVNSVEALGDKIGWKGVGATGGGSGYIRGLYKTVTGRGSNEEAALRNEIGNIKGTIAKLRGGSAFSKQELEMLEAYVPTIGEDPTSIKTKLQGLRQWLKFQDESIREQFGDSPAETASTGRVYYDAQGNPIKR